MNAETREQKEVISWWDVAASSYGLDPRHLIHVPNGGKRRKVEAAILKGMGVRAGAPDLVLLVPKMVTGTAEFRGALMIEMKSKDGRISSEQRDYLDLLSRAGFATAVAWSSEEAIRYVINYLRTGDPLKR